MEISAINGVSDAQAVAWKDGYSEGHDRGLAKGRDEYRADLRAKVEALRDNAKEWQEKSPVQSPWTAYVGAYDHVLDLIDKGSDGH
jgi:hypothetical protein